DLRHRIDAGVVLITHDMGVVADMADRILVMKDGRIVESGTADEIFHHARHEYTRSLLAAVPHFGRHARATTEQETEAAGHEAFRRETAEAEPVPGQVDDRPVVVEMRDLVLEYPKRGSQPVFRAVDEVDLTIRQGEVVG